MSIELGLAQQDQGTIDCVGVFVSPCREHTSDEHIRILATLTPDALKAHWRRAQRYKQQYLEINLRLFNRKVQDVEDAWAWYTTGDLDGGPPIRFFRTEEGRLRLLTFLRERDGE